MVTRLRVQINGSLGGPSGPERWSVGLNFGGGPVLTNVECAAAAEDMVNDVGSYLLSPGDRLPALLSGSGFFTDVDVYSYGPSGPAVAGGSDAASSPVPGDGAANCPPQCCAVFSLLTGQAGASRRGRVYWPCLVASMTSGLKSGNALAAGVEFAAMASIMQQSLQSYGPWELGVYSPTLDAITTVTSIRSGDVVDTQRRRRDSMQELYVTNPFPA